MIKKKNIFKITVTFIFTLILPFALSNNTAEAQIKVISTDRGSMEAFAGGGYLPATKEKLFEATSSMMNGNHTRLYLKSTTVEYLSGKQVHSVARFGGAQRTFIHDYFYLKGYSNKSLTTYSTHEAIWTNAHSVMITVVY